jgi:AcrR family transcriptional regulator
MNQSDLRVQRTHRLLREALIELSIEHGYDAITVRDITARAQVGYKTFYRHYNDKDDLLYRALGEILQEGLPILLPPEEPNAPEQNTIIALRFADKYADLFRVLLRSPAAEKLLQPLIAFGLAEGKRFFGGSDVPDDLVAYHFATSMMFLIRWWLEHERPWPPEQMAEYIIQLVIRPVRNLRDAQPQSADSTLPRIH